MKFQSYAPESCFIGEPEQIEAAVRHCMSADLLGVDTETVGLLKDPETGRKYTNMTDRVVVMGLCPDDKTRYLVPVRFLRDFAPVLSSSIPKTFSNVKFDVHRIYNSSGIIVSGPWVDTVVLDYLIDENERHGLKECMNRYFNIEMLEYKDLFGKIDPEALSPGHILWERYVDYASLDPWATRKLAQLLMKKLSRMPVWDDDGDKTFMDVYWETEEPQLRCLWEMERHGFFMDRQYLADLTGGLTTAIEDKAFEINEMVGHPINPGSTQQVAQLLFQEMGLPCKKMTKSGKQASTDDEVLQDLAHGTHQVDVCKKILEYRGLVKMNGTYAEGMLKWISHDGRIHQTYTPTLVTGRLSCSDPNLQNIPQPIWDVHKIRRAFIAAPGNSLVVGDYGALEMRILAAACEDQTLVEGILGGLDMHSFTAARFMDIPYDDFIKAKKGKEAWALEARQAYKSVGFSIVYGTTEYGLSIKLSEELKRHVSLQEATKYIEGYIRTVFPGVGQYIDDTRSFCVRNGYVRTICGRRRRLPDAQSRDKWAKARALRQAINTPIQGSAADIVKRVMIAINADDYLRNELGFRVIHQVHDELILEGPTENAEEAREIATSYMEHPFTEDLIVPLPVDMHVVSSWDQAKE